MNFAAGFAAKAARRTALFANRATVPRNRRMRDKITAKFG